MDIQASLASYALSRPEWVKQYIDSSMGADYDPLLIALINGFSKLAQGQFCCNRNFALTSYTEYFNVYNTTTQAITVSAPPISVSETLTVHEDLEGVYGTSSLLKLRTDYMIEYDTGLIRKPYSYFLCGHRVVKVVYTGGLVVNGSDVNEWDIVIPDDLRSACEMQVAHWFKHREDMNVVDLQMAGARMTMQRPDDLLKPVRMILLENRRHN
jgi:hypothetical protein